MLPYRATCLETRTFESGHDDARLRCLQTLPDTMREATLRSPLDAGLVYCGPIDASVCLAVEVALATPPRKADSLLEGGLVSCADCSVPPSTLNTLYLGLEPVTDTDNLSSCHEEDVETEWCSEVDRGGESWTSPERSEENE